jgi:hypothetical protein
MGLAGEQTSLTSLLQMVENVYTYGVWRPYGELARPVH